VLANTISIYHSLRSTLVNADKNLARENGSSSLHQKKSYRSPKLLVYGDVRKITQNTGHDGEPDSAPGGDYTN
jgi:hypothetical protein